MVSFPLALGIDFGTSGARGAVVNPDKQPVWQCRQPYPDNKGQLPQGWQTTLFSLLGGLPTEVAQALGAIAINGTSATVLLIDEQGNPLVAPLMYNDTRAKKVIGQVRSLVPLESPAVSASSSLAKLIWWSQSLAPEVWKPARYCLSQADWLSAQLHGQWGISDYHNSLKLGYDVSALQYPAWLQNQPWSHLLPQVVAPGTVIDQVEPNLAHRFNLPSNCQVVAGTTDSIAAFLASGAQHIGDAVTSLGSTLVLKLLSQKRVDSNQHGIYSHRLGNLWLVGGASNSGGAVLQHFFDTPTLSHLSEQIDLDQSVDLDYYPLLSRGERFPINNPDLEPRLSPRPQDDATFLHGLLLGIARIEKQGYGLLETLGASPPRQILTSGGGANNKTWLKMRANLLQKPIKRAAHTEAAVGSAYLALDSLRPN